MYFRRSLTLAGVAALLRLLAANGARADFDLPVWLPFERVETHARAYLAAHPAEAEAHYTLARVHYLAFVRGEGTVPVLRETGEGEKPAVASDGAISFDLYEARQKHAEELALKDVGERGPRPSAEKASAFEEARGKRARQLEEQDWQPRGSLSTAQMIAHAATALAEFREAGRLDPKGGAPVLGLAALSEKFARWAAAEPPGKVPAELRSLSLAAARDAYLRAFRLAIVADRGLASMPAGGPASLVSHEAGNAYVRLTDENRARLKPADKAALEEVKAGLKKLKKLKVGPVAL